MMNIFLILSLQACISLKNKDLLKNHDGDGAVKKTSLKK